MTPTAVRDYGEARVQALAAPVNAQVSKPELRVLQVFSVLGMGGAETWLISLLRYFAEHESALPVKVKTDILLTSGEPGLFDAEAKALGARLFYVPFGRRYPLSFAREFRKILRSGNYAAIHDHQDYIAGLHFLLGAGDLPKIRIAHVHNPLYHRINDANRSSRRFGQTTGKRLLSKLATHVMGTSKQILDEYGFNDPAFRRVTTDAAHCGIDPLRFSGDRRRAHQDVCEEFGWDDASRVILFVGRLDGAEIEFEGRRMSHKNPQFALEVARLCLEQDPSVRMILAGDGQSKRSLFEGQVAQWGLEGKICFLGTRRDIERLMLGSDLLLFPSLAEGLGMVVVEAQAAGLPVLASDTTPREAVVIPEMVDFASLSAEPAAWASAALERLGQACDAAACNDAVSRSAFSIENSAKKLLSLYSA